MHKGSNVRIALKEIAVQRGSTYVLSNMSLEFKGPGLIQVIGPNGAGKTTLLETIASVLKPVSGEVRIDVPNDESPPLVYMPHDIKIPGDAPLTTWEFVELRLKAWGIKDNIRSRVARALETVGLTSDLWGKRVSDLSRGQLQRALLARTIAVDAHIMLLDEPLSNIDPEGRTFVSKVIGELAEEKLILMTSHDPMMLYPYTSRILLLNKTQYLYGRPEEVLRAEVLEKIYAGCLAFIREVPHIADWH